MYLKREKKVLMMFFFLPEHVSGVVPRLQLSEMLENRVGSFSDRSATVLSRLRDFQHSSQILFA